MCAKQLYVKSNGTWVAAGGAGGSVDTAGLATEQFVTDAIGAGGFATLTDLNDALATIPESAITLHAGPVPDAGADTPKGLEDAFGVLDDGLHYFKDVGTLVSITRQEYQTTIVLSGQLSSFAKIVKSEAGLPTPQNPSMIVMQRAEGQWLKLTSDALDEPFGKPQQVDIFALTGAGADLTNYYTKPEVDGLLGPIRVDIGGLTSNQEQFLKQGDLDQTNGQIQALATLTQDALTGLDKKADKTTVTSLAAVAQDALAGLDAKADKTTVNALATTLMNSITEVKSDTYTKKEVDDKLEADKDFSIANDNVLLASITSLQEIVSNLGEVGTGQIDVLDAIKGVTVEPLSVKFTESTASPIQWKGGLSLTPTQDGSNYRLVWNDGRSASALCSFDDITPDSLKSVLLGADLALGSVSAMAFVSSGLRIGSNGTQIVTRPESGGALKTVAYTEDLVGPHVFDATNSLVVATPPGDTANRVCWKSGTKTFGLATQSDLSGYAPISTTTLITTQLQAVFDSIYTRAESDDRYAKASDPNQTIKARSVWLDGILFEGGNAGIAYMDTGEGYGKRLVFSEGPENDYLVYKSDLDSLLPGTSSVDTSQFATTATVAALGVRVKAVEDRPVPYTKNEVDQRIANCVTVGAWVNATSGANWGAGSTLSSRKIGSDMTQIDCSITFNTPLAANTWQDLGVLASTARPAKDTNFTAVAMDGSGVPQIVSVWAYATGRVAIRNYGSITSVRFNDLIAPR